MNRLRGRDLIQIYARIDGGYSSLQYLLNNDEMPEMEKNRCTIQNYRGIIRDKKTLGFDCSLDEKELKEQLKLRRRLKAALNENNR